jgi:hypothetical protein
MPLFNSISPFFRQIKFSLFIAICGLFAFGILLSFPIQRQVGLTFRYDFTIPLILFLAIFFPIFYQDGKYWKLASFMLVCVFFALPISGLWSSGQSEQYILSGIIPFSDSRYYYADVRNLIEGNQFFTPHSRRPLFSAFFAPILAGVGGNLQVALAIMVLLTAVSCYLAAREIQASLGTTAAVLTVFLEYLFFRPISGKVLSEGLGFPLCLLSLILFLYAARKNNRLSAFCGLFLISLALCARAGAFFILPALIVWIVWHFRVNAKISLQTTVICLLMIGLGFGINQFIYSMFVSAKSLPFSNFSLTFYGLAVGGKGWLQIFTDHPEIANLPEPYYSQKIMQFAFEVLQRKPINLLIGSFNSWALFFSTDDYYSLFNWVGGGRPIIGTLSRLGLYFLILVGIIDTIRYKKDPIKQLIFLTFLGITLSVPFAPPLDSNRMRVYASVIPFLFLLPAIGLSSIIKFLKLPALTRPAGNISNIYSTIFLSSVIIFTLLFGSLITRVAAKPKNIPLDNCSPGKSSVTLRLSPGAIVNTTNPETTATDWLPDIRLNTFISRSHNLPNWETFPVFDNMQIGKTLANEIDIPTERIILFISDTSLLPPLPSLIQACGYFSVDKMVSEYNVFFADSVVKLANQ